METKLVNQQLQRRKGLWSTKDILVTGMIGVVFSFVLIAATYAYLAVIGGFGPAFARVFNGVYLIPGLMALYLIRKPGAALVAQLIAGTVMIPFSPYGWFMLIGQGVNGLTTEIPFFSVLYKKYSLAFLMVAGGVASCIGTLSEYPMAGYASLDASIQLTMFTISAISGGLGGLIAKILAEAVMKTGLLSEYQR